jgi:hypothetical protein
MGRKMNIYEKMIEVRKAVPFLKKDSKGHQYNYVSSSTLLIPVIEAMNKHGIMLTTSVKGKTNRILEGTKPRYMTQLDIEYTFINAEKPEESITVYGYGEGIDEEKGIGKALTYAEKYMLLKTFSIPTDKDDPDAYQTPPAFTKKKEDAVKATDEQRAIIKAWADSQYVDEKYRTRLAENLKKDLTSADAENIITKMENILHKEHPATEQ